MEPRWSEWGVQDHNDVHPQVEDGPSRKRCQKILTLLWCFSLCKTLCMGAVGPTQEGEAKQPKGGWPHLRRQLRQQGLKAQHGQELDRNSWTESLRSLSSEIRSYVIYPAGSPSTGTRFLGQVEEFSGPFLRRGSLGGDGGQQEDHGERKPRMQTRAQGDGEEDG